MNRRAVAQARRIERTLDRLGDGSAIARRMAAAGMDALEARLRIPNTGFTDRKGRLRKDLIRASAEQDAVVVETLTARQWYARIVENTPRTKDQRPGPPYWVGPALKHIERRGGDAMNEAARARIEDATTGAGR